MKILGIESSCDESAAAVVSGEDDNLTVVASAVASQIAIHKKYGGVVPEVAAREHVLNILPVIDEALQQAGANRSDVINRVSAIDAIAVTIGPGLITSLQVGVETAKALAYVWQIPIVAVNHIEGHIYANFIDNNSTFDIRHSTFARFPAVVLTVSGGHTSLILMKDHGRYETIGETRDDAAGEAFDKAAQLLGLGYPGGPAIAAEAAKCRMSNVECRIKLPRPMINSSDFDFSFSGLKTALLYKIKKDPNYKLSLGPARDRQIANYAKEFQQAVIDVLIAKTVKAAKKYDVRTVMLSGGVTANQELRAQMQEKMKKELPDLRFTIPDLRYTTDNAAMIAAAGYFHALKKEFTPWDQILVDCNAEL